MRKSTLPLNTKANHMPDRAFSAVNHNALSWLRRHRRRKPKRFDCLPIIVTIKILGDDDSKFRRAKELWAAQVATGILDTAASVSVITEKESNAQTPKHNEESPWITPGHRGRLTTSTMSRNRLLPNSRVLVPTTYREWDNALALLRGN